MGLEFKFPLAAVETLKRRLESLTELTAPEAKQVGQAAVERMKKLIASGQSPIEGPGISSRFAPYKHPDRYPGKRKPHSPVNLRLTGEMLDSLGFVVLPRSDKRGYAAHIGYDSVQSTLKESGHREGVHGQPRRPTIPDSSRKETFVSSIVDAYRKVVLDAIRKR